MVRVVVACLIDIEMEGVWVGVGWEREQKCEKDNATSFVVFGLAESLCQTITSHHHLITLSLCNYGRMSVKKKKQAG